MDWDALDKDVAEFFKGLGSDCKGGAIAVAVLGLISGLFFIAACFIHNCVMNIILYSLAIAWALFNLLLLIGILTGIEFLFLAWMYITPLYALAMAVLMIVYAAHCCCCCIRPHGCGIALLVVGIIYHFSLFLQMLVVNCGRNQAVSGGSPSPGGGGGGGDGGGE